MADTFRDPLLLELQTQALGLPEVTETGACVKRSFKAAKKSFLFLGEKDDEINLMVKLTHSIGDAEALAGASTTPGRVAVGKNGWVTVKLPPGTDLPGGVLARWVLESYRNQVPRRLLAALEGRG